MAPRSFWKGYLRLSLVTCRVAMAPATWTQRRLRFHTLNRATGNRVESRYVDEATGKPVREDDQARGYPVSPDRLVLLDDAELEAVALESTRTIEIDMFVPRDDIAWIWLDTPHYLTPDDRIAEEAFAVTLRCPFQIALAMAASPCPPTKTRTARQGSGARSVLVSRGSTGGRPRAANARRRGAISPTAPRRLGRSARCAPGRPATGCRRGACRGSRPGCA